MREALTRNLIVHIHHPLDFDCLGFGLPFLVSCNRFVQGFLDELERVKKRIQPRRRAVVSLSFCIKLVKSPPPQRRFVFFVTEHSVAGGCYNGFQLSIALIPLDGEEQLGIIEMGKGRLRILYGRTNIPTLLFRDGCPGMLSFRNII